MYSSITLNPFPTLFDSTDYDILVIRRVPGILRSILPAPHNILPVTY